MRYLPTLVLASLLLARVAAAAAEPPPTWGLGLRIAPYEPAMGHRGSGEKAYFDDFFNNPFGIMWQLQADRFVTDIYGPLGIFVRSGRWSVSAKNRVCTSDGADVACTTANVTDGSAKNGAGASTFRIIPITAGIEYRAAILQRGYKIPIVPYANVAYDYFLWWMDSEGSGNDEAKGGTAGVEATFGLAFNLDWLAPTTADRPVFQNSYLFVETTRIWGNGFGNQRKLNVSDHHFALGFNFEFE